MEERPLSALRPGERAMIGRLDGGGPVRQRLLELGLTPGTAVTLVRLAPLRDPMEIRVRGYQLCVRRAEADAVWVRDASSEIRHGVQHGDSETRRSEQDVPNVAVPPSALCPSPAAPGSSVSPCLP